MSGEQSNLSRRNLLATSSVSLSSVALAWLLNRDSRAAGQSNSANTQPASPYAAKPPHFQPRAKRVIQIFCAGGVSHVDTFDYKPDLAKHHGKELTGKGEIDPFFGQPGRLLKSPFAFKQHGECEQWVSDLLPHIATRVDDICFVRSMVAKNNNHTPATFAMNSGFTMNGFPCMGAWVSYGLGSLNENLPAFVVLPDPRGLPAGGSINWQAGFLPATHQGTAFRTGYRGGPAGDASEPIVDLRTPGDVDPAARQAGMKLLDRMNRRFAERNEGVSELKARVRAYELAAQMQMSVPEAIDLSRESDSIKESYGLNREETRGFGRNCLMARRLLERGVRFVQLFNGGAFGGMPRKNWDAHEDIVRNHTIQATTVDQPVAALLADLKQRGMLDDTLVVFSTEFGRTPFTQGLKGKGRDHHQHAFTCWLAGGGVRPGYAHGESDEVGYAVADKPVTVYDFHATILHLLGIEHTKLTYYHNGIQRRLTDVHGHVVRELLA